MFSVISVCPRGDSHVTITHDALTSLYRPLFGGHPAWTRDLGILPPPPTDILWSKLEPFQTCSLDDPSLPQSWHLVAIEVTGMLARAGILSCWKTVVEPICIYSQNYPPYIKISSILSHGVMISNFNVVLETSGLPSIPRGIRFGIFPACINSLIFTDFCSAHGCWKIC